MFYKTNSGQGKRKKRINQKLEGKKTLPSPKLLCRFFFPALSGNFENQKIQCWSYVAGGLVGIVS